MRDVPAPSAPAPGGKRDANNALYFELGGPGLLYTVNYERATSVRSGASSTTQRTRWFPRTWK